jgi:hypothetical protein
MGLPLSATKGAVEQHPYLPDRADVESLHRYSNYGDDSGMRRNGSGPVSAPPRPSRDTRHSKNLAGNLNSVGFAPVRMRQ